MSRNISDLRDHLFEALVDIRNGKMPPDQARVLSEVAKVIVDTAKVEVDYLRLTEEGQSRFLSGEPKPPLPSGYLGVRQHRMADD